MLLGRLLERRHVDDEAIFHVAVQALPAGVYIAMNGKCFPWDRVRKTASAGSLKNSRRPKNKSGTQKSRKEDLNPWFSVQILCWLPGIQAHSLSRLLS